MKQLLWLFPLLAAAQAPIGIEKGIVYSPGSRLMMDIARPEGPGPYPAVIAIHGGKFTAGDRADWLLRIGQLAQHGFVAAAVDYRLAPHSQFPAPLQDVKAAVRFLRANAQKFAIDPDRIGAIGEDSGGQLALLLALTPGVAEFDGGANRELSSRVSCVVALSAPTDLTSTTGVPEFLGGTLEYARTEHIMASPVSWVTPQAPPILLVGGGQQAQALASQLKRVNTLAYVIDASQAERPMLAFLSEHLGLNPPKHILLVCDHGARGQVVALEWPSGRELWTVPNRNGHDAQPLPNGHVLYTMGNDHKVVEMDESHNPVWTYGPEEGLQHPISAERLPNGNTLIGDAQLGKVIEVDRDRKVVWKYESADLANMRMRNSRRTAAGTTLISVEAAGKIIEVNAAGEIIWSYIGDGGPKRRPYKGMRLPNGNTLITLNDPGELVEVTPAGKVVRSIGGEKGDIRMIWSSGFDVMPDGNVLISDYQGHRVMEIGKDGKVVHEVRYPTRSTASIAFVQ